MKKVFSFLLIPFFLVSCSNNDEEPTKETPKLLIKLEQIETGSSSDTHISHYNYDSGNFLTGITNNDTFFSKAHYDSNDNLVKLDQENYNVSDNYEYLNNKLVKHSRVEDNSIVRSIEYTYDSNNLLISEKETYHYNTPTTTIYNYEYDGNNVKKINATNTGSYTIIKYDGKNFPFSEANHVKRIFPLIKLGNIIEERSYSNEKLNYTKTNTITYDNDDFPTVIVVNEVDDIGNTWEETRNYTYNK